MIKNLVILAFAAAVVALPFILRKPAEERDWKQGDPVLVAISAHNEAIRQEFSDGFSNWHKEKHGSPAKIDWRTIGGTTEITRYLRAETVSSFRSWWRSEDKEWPGNGAEIIYSYKSYDARNTDIFKALRATDDPAAVTTQIDVLFGGGEYDHNKLAKQGITVKPWPSEAAAKAAGIDLDKIPKRISGETWRNDYLIGNAVSTFGICYNKDRLQDLGIESPPSSWMDLTDPRYFRQIATADPTKSGSITKAFEMMIHQQVGDAIGAAGFTTKQIEAFEARETDSNRVEKTDAYLAAASEGWLKGVHLVQRIGANARYLTDSSSKVPIDVSKGDAAVGMCIDFYGRYQAEIERRGTNEPHMVYVTPVGGSSVSCDPISLLRGAPNRELALRFFEFVLTEPGQRLWNYEHGKPGGPEKFSLRRLPIHRDFYPSPDDPAANARHTEHAKHATDDLANPLINPYAVAETFTYRYGWTGHLFGLHRILIKTMCLDSGDELRAAWKAIIAAGGPEAQPEAMALLTRLPPEISWQGASDIKDPQGKLREWTTFFRNSYKETKEAVDRKTTAK